MGGKTELRLVAGGLPADVRARAELATRLATLEDVLRFAFAQDPAWELADVIVQDEYTHDVIVQGPAPAFLVFDTT
jgi:hypothetical protein